MGRHLYRGSMMMMMMMMGVLVVGVASASAGIGKHVSASDEEQFQYDPAKAARALALAELSYCITVPEENYLPDATVTRVVRQAVSGGLAVVGRDKTDGTVFVAYRGSSNVRNWIENAKFVKTSPYTDIPNVAVERGFYDWYQDLNASGVYDAVFETLDDGEEKPRHLKVVGHSAGGACATLFAFDASTRGVFGEGVVLKEATTFGSPRVGDSAFAQTYQDSAAGPLTTRVTHARDVVPHLPMENAFHFEHVATEVFYNEPNTAYTVCDGSGEDPRCSDKCAPFLCTSVDDHMHYLNVSLGTAGCPSSGLTGAAARGVHYEDAHYPDIPMVVVSDEKMGVRDNDKAAAKKVVDAVVVQDAA